MSARAVFSLVAPRSLQLVTSTGELRKVTKESDAELFWALSGAGQGLGVVTHFKFRLHDLHVNDDGSHGMAGVILYPATDDVMEALLSKYLAEVCTDTGVLVQTDVGCHSSNFVSFRRVISTESCG
jgi:hypothetical protein